METSTPTCVLCERTSQEVPLVKWEFQNREFHICPQHLPVIIHNPSELIDRLPGAENLEPAEHKD
ncbi:MAG: hypothetical protein JXQ90_16215 [Cyclobacteriaceae bacterium]